MNDTKNVRLICNTDSDEFMVHWPNGAVEFVGLWGMLKLCWWLVRNGKNATIVDAKTGQESEA
jgi:hypothetical protein